MKSLVRIPAPLSRSSWPPTFALSSMFTPAISTALASVAATSVASTMMSLRMFASSIDRGAADCGSDGLEYSGGAHACADAHGNHPVFLLPALHAMHDRRGADGARRPPGMAKGDGSAQRIDLCRIHVEVPHHRDALRGEGLVEFNPVDLVERQTRRFQYLGNGGN